jgi:hypothetical protein
MPVIDVALDARPAAVMLLFGDPTPLAPGFERSVVDKDGPSPG